MRDVSDEVGSVMEAVGKADIKPSNGVRNNVVREAPRGLVGKIKGMVQERKHKVCLLALSNSSEHYSAPAFTTYNVQRTVRLIYSSFFNSI